MLERFLVTLRGVGHNGCRLFVWENRASSDTCDICTEATTHMTAVARVCVMARGADEVRFGGGRGSPAGVPDSA